MNLLCDDQSMHDHNTVDTVIW